MSGGRLVAVAGVGYLAFVLLTLLFMKGATR